MLPEVETGHNGEGEVACGPNVVEKPTTISAAKACRPNVIEKPTTSASRHARVHTHPFPTSEVFFILKKRFDSTNSFQYYIPITY